MWKSADTPTDKAAQMAAVEMVFDKWLIGAQASCGVAMIYVLVRNFKWEKLVYLSTTATMMLLSAFTGVLYAVLKNWYNGCTYFYTVNNRCHG
jgi:hypothetical protein